MIHNYKSCWPTLGPYRYLRGAPKGPFGLKQALTGRKALGARLGARFGSNCRRLVQLGWSHGYHTLWPGIGPLLGPQGPQKGPLWPKMPLLGVLEVLGEPGGAIFGLNSLGLPWTHGYHRLWPGIKPLPGGNFDFWPHIGPHVVQKRDI